MERQAVIPYVCIYVLHISCRDRTTRPGCYYIVPWALAMKSRDSLTLKTSGIECKYVSRFVATCCCCFYL